MKLMVTILTVIFLNFIDSPFTTATRYHVDYQKSWFKFENFTSILVQSIASDFDRHLRTVLNQTSQITAECSNSLIKWIKDLKSLDPKAVKQFDSWGRIPSGLMSGGWIDHGGFEECLSLDESQYCLLFVHLPLTEEQSIEGYGRPYDPIHFNFSTNLFTSLVNYVHFFRYMNITSALCLPKGCSSLELTQLANVTAKSLQIGLNVDVDLCQNRYDYYPYTWGQIFSFSLILLVLTVTLIGTYWSSPKSFLYHFNFKVNCSKLFSPIHYDRQMMYSEGFELGSTLVYLNGIKAITMLILVFIHLAFTILPTNFKTSFTMYNLTRSPTINIFFIGGYMTDTFFLITGLESAWNLLGHTYDQQKRSSFSSSFSLLTYLLLRWVRFAPSIIWIIAWKIILFSSHTRNWIGGPLWSHKRAAGSVSNSCQDNWLYHILFVAHFFDTADDFGYCILSDWYIESDFLYHVAFIPVIYTFIKNKPSLSIIYSIIMVTLGSLTTTFIIELYGTHHSWLTTTFPNRAFFKYLTSIHGKPWSHLGSYFMGVLSVFILIKIKSQFNQITRAIIWSIWSSLWLILFFYDYTINTRSQPIGYGVSLLFAATNKFLWSLIVIWLIYCLHHGLISSKVRSFFSCHIFTVLSRISCSVLLVNIMLMMIRNATYQTPTYMVMGEQIFSLVIPIYVSVYTVSFIFSILIESPTRSIIKSIVRLKVDPSEALTKKYELTSLNNNSSINDN